MDIETGPVPLPPLARRPDAGPVVATPGLGQRLRAALPGSVPVLLMAGLALTTSWLARNTPLPEPERGPAVESPDPDYEMRGFSVQRYAGAGAARALIEGDAARHYPMGDRLQIDGVRLRWTDREGRTLHAEADRAELAAPAQRLQLDGQVRLWQDSRGGNGSAAAEPGLEMRGEAIEIDLAHGRARSQRPVELRQGSSHFTAQGLNYDHVSQMLVLDGGVQGTLQPHSRAAGPATAPAQP